MMEIELANKVAVESGHKALNHLAEQKKQPQNQELCRNLISQADDTLFKFKTVVSLLGNRFSVARARRFKNFTLSNLPKNLFIEALQSINKPNSETDPKSKKPSIFVDDSGIDTSLSVKPPSAEVSQRKPPRIPQFRPNELQMMHFADMSSNRSFMSSFSMDGSVTNSFQTIGLLKPSDPNSQQLIRRKCSFKGEDGILKCVTKGSCHCTTRRKLRIKRSIKVPAISNRIADIPPDEYSWRKYGQKPINGSSYPRGYYRCSMMRGCPARKHVERCMEEPTMLVVTYEGDHNHPRMEVEISNSSLQLPIIYPELVAKKLDSAQDRASNTRDRMEESDDDRMTAY